MRQFIFTPHKILSFRPVKLALSLTALIAISTISANAGTEIIQSYQKLTEKSEPTTNKIFLDKDAVRIESGLTQGQYFIYRTDKKVFWAINTKDKTYLEMTQKDFEDMVVKMEEARKKMAEQMAKMPPEQKEMMEKMMAKMLPDAAGGPKTTFKKIGSGGKVNGWNTDKYEGMREGVKQSEIWTADPKTLGVTDADYQVLKDIAKFFEKFAKNMDSFIGDKAKNGMDGIPVKTLNLKEGQPEFSTEIKEVKKENFSADLFQVPAGLTKKNMGQMMGKPEAKAQGK